MCPCCSLLTAQACAALLELNDQGRFCGRITRNIQSRLWESFLRLPVLNAGASGSVPLETDRSAFAAADG